MGGYFQREPEGRMGLQLPGLGSRPVVTWTLLAINGVIWVAMEAAGGSEEPEVLLDFGALFGPFIADGQYWRLFTAMFLHVGLVHLLFNGFGLLIFGQLVERVFGHVRFAIIYVIAGLAGSVASYMFNSIAIGAGASGAIFGVLGALTAFFLVRRDVLGEMGRQNLMGLLVLAAINLLFGVVTPGIDNWAHMGGFVAGFAVGLAYAPQYQPVLGIFGGGYQVAETNPMLQRWWVLPLAVVALLAGTWLATSSMPETSLSYIRSAERLLEEESYEMALTEVEQAIRLDPFIGQAHFVRGKILAQLGDVGGARSELSGALRLGLDTEHRKEAVALLLALGARP